MMLMGWCTTCRKFKYVRVLGVAAMSQPIVQGTCASCEDVAAKQRLAEAERNRRPRRHP